MSLGIQQTFPTQAGDTIEIVTPADGSFYLGLVSVPSGGQPIQLDLTMQEVLALMQLLQSVNTMKRIDAGVDKGSVTVAPVPATLTAALKVQPLPPVQQQVSAKL